MSSSKLLTLAVRCLFLPADAGRPSYVIIEGTVVDRVAATLVELTHFHKVAAVILEGSYAFILFHHSAWRTSRKHLITSCCPDFTELLQVEILTRKMFCHPDPLIVRLSRVFHPSAKRGFHLGHIPGIYQRLNEAFCKNRRHVYLRTHCYVFLWIRKLTVLLIRLLEWFHRHGFVVWNGV